MPQPIDFQTEVGRTTAAERIQHIADRAQMAQAQRLAEEAQRLQTESEQHVHETPEAQSEHVDEETKRRTPYGRRRKRGQQEDDTDAHRSPVKGGIGDEEGHQLDVSV